MELVDQHQCGRVRSQFSQAPVRRLDSHDFDAWKMGGPLPQLVNDRRPVRQDPDPALRARVSLCHRLDENTLPVSDRRLEQDPLCALFESVAHLCQVFGLVVSQHEKAPGQTRPGGS